MKNQLETLEQILANTESINIFLGIVVGLLLSIIISMLYKK